LFKLEVEVGYDRLPFSSVVCHHQVSSENLTQVVHSYLSEIHHRATEMPYMITQCYLPSDTGGTLP